MDPGTWGVTEMKFLIQALGSMTSFLGKAGGVVLFCMMLLTVCDVIGRYLFNAPIMGGYELTETMMATAVFLFIGYTQAAKKHISVDFLILFLPERGRWFLNLVTHTICLAVFGAITWMNVLRWMELMHRNEHTPILHLPISPFLLVVAFGSFVFFVELLKDICGLFQRRPGF